MPDSTLDADERIVSRLEELVALRRHLHRNPELSHEEFETTKLMSEKLVELGFDVHVRSEGTGFYADLTPPDFDESTHRTVAIRADLDALAIDELNAVPYRSERPGVMHACGHDVHMTCAYAVGLALADPELIDALPGRIRLIYQHAEEQVGGADEMVEFGAMKGVDWVLALHVDPELEVGKVGVRSGPFTAAFDEFEIKVIGESGHGARPQHCIDPIFVITQLANALYNALGRTFDARDPMVLSIGMIEGGKAPNIIPENASMTGSIRSLSDEHRAAVEPMLVRICDGICSTYGARYDLSIRHGAPAIINDAGVTDLIADIAGEMLGEENVHRIPLPSMGSEDYSFFLEQAPGAMFRLGAATEDRPRFFLHSARFNVDERAIGIGARVLTRAALRLLRDRR